MDARRRMRLKLVLIGDYGVGKSSLMRQYLDRTFLEAGSHTGPQEDERVTSVDVEGETCDVWLTDTAGQEQFRRYFLGVSRRSLPPPAADRPRSFLAPHHSFTSSYLRDKDGALAVFDVCNRASFESLAHWVGEIYKWEQNTVVVLVGNKIDLAEERKVTTREAEDFAKSVRAVDYVETSAKLEINCIKAFEALMRHCYKRRRHDGAESITSSPTVSLRPPQPDAPTDNSFPCGC